MLSVLTITKREGWLPVAVDSLSNQTDKDFEWVIVHEPNVPQETIDAIKNYRWIAAPPKRRHSNLNASWNEGLRHCSGNIVVFYQDFIQLDRDTLAKLRQDVGETYGFVTTATINPDGAHDARYTGVDGLRTIPHQEWEANVAAAPMRAIKELGGFDETYDDGWSWDNVNLAARAELLGYTFHIDESIKPRLLYHQKEPEADPTLELNYLRHEMTMRSIAIGDKPIKLNHVV